MAEAAAPLAAELVKRAPRVAPGKAEARVAAALMEAAAAAPKMVLRVMQLPREETGQAVRSALAAADSYLEAAIIAAAPHRSLQGSRLFQADLADRQILAAAEPRAALVAAVALVTEHRAVADTAAAAAAAVRPAAAAADRTTMGLIR